MVVFAMVRSGRSICSWLPLRVDARVPAEEMCAAGMPGRGRRRAGCGRRNDPGLLALALCQVCPPAFVCINHKPCLAASLPSCKKCLRSDCDCHISPLPNTTRFALTHP